MDDEKRAFRAYFLMIISVSVTSMANIFIKLGLKFEWSPAAIASYRMAIAAAIMIVVAFSSPKCRKEVKTLQLTDIIKMILAGTFMGLHFVFWAEALKYTTAANAVVLACTQPVFLMIAGVLFFKEKLNLKVLLCALIPILGVLLITFSSSAAAEGGGTLVGDLMILGTMSFYITQILLGRSVRQRVSVKLYTAIVYTCCTVAIVLVGLIQGTQFTGLDPRGIPVVIGLALLVTLCGHNIIIYTLKYLKPAAIAIFQMGEVILTAFWAFLLFQEVPSWMTVLGGTVILSGIYLFVRIEEKEKNRLLIINDKNKQPRC
ncbi:MAG: DMT family transporter [Christensenellales bacterium]